MGIPLSSIRALDSLAGAGGVFKLLAADHRGSFLPLLAPDDPGGVTEAEITEAKRDIVAELSPHVTGVMLNPTPAADCVASGSLAGSAALIVTSESDGYEAVSRGEAAKLIDGWRLDRARELGATAIKILVQQPLGSAELRRLDRDFVLGVHSTCRELDLCIVLEVLVPDGDSGRGADWSDALVRAAAELSPYCDLYKTSFPELGDDPERGREACARLTAESAAPWVVLSGGASPGQFERRLEIACREGASGFLAGRSVWGDALAGDKAGRRARLRELAVTRLERYGEIADRAARPWRVQCAEELGHDLVPAPGRFVPAPLALVAERKGGR